MSRDSAKTSRRHVFLTHIRFTGRASSPSPSFRSSKAVASSAAQETNPSSSQAVSSSTAPAGPVFPDLLIAGTGPSSLSLQATSTPWSSSNLLHNVLKRLSDNDRATLQGYICHNTSDICLGLEQALVAAKEKQRHCIEKRLTFTIKGHTIALKEKADKVVGWLNRFTAVGDVVANVDPVHVGLPWAGVRLLLEVTVSEANQMTSLLDGCEIALYIANRLKAYIDFLHQVPIMLTRTNLETAVTELYALVLAFLARAIRIYQTSTPYRAFRAFWTKDDIMSFEKACSELGDRVTIEASNCDRALSAQDRERSERLRQDLQRVLGELEQSHLLQESLDRLETKIDLDKLPYAKGAMYNSSEDDYNICHTATRVDLLHDIYGWARDPHSKSIFWLSGWAGIGKSTISRTVAKRLADRGGRNGINLGASFFFKRGEGNRGSALRFFPTIVRQLVLKIPGLDAIVAKVVAQDPLIFDKALGEQFDKLIHQPLQQVETVANSCSTFIVVVDALDECEKERDIKTIIDLWSLLIQSNTVRLKLFLTSRPDLPVQLGFRNISAAIHQDIVLQDAVPQTTIQHDILIFLKDEFGNIRDSYNLEPLSGRPLDQDWPGDGRLQDLVDMAVPLFVIAVTVCRFVGDLDWDPRERLEKILQYPSFGKSKNMAQTYLPVLTQLSVRLKTSDNENEIYQDFRTIVGSIVVLAEPLSRQSLADLLKICPDMIVRRLRPLHSVLRIPTEIDIPIRTLHLSFNEFLLSDQLRSEPFGVDGHVTHRMLLLQCLRLLSGPSGLQENLCKLEYPGQLRREIDPSVISDRLSPALQYACQYWIQHVQYSEVEIQDEDGVHKFLRRHFLHWLEAMSLMNRLAEVIQQIRVLQSLVSSNKSSHLSNLLRDMQRTVLANRYCIDLAPLQIYSSAMIFAPQASIVRQICGRVPSWIRRYPVTLPIWSLELQKLEGHTDEVNAVVFSSDGSLLASASGDQTVRLWNPATGQEVQKLEGHTSRVNAVVFSPDRSLLASASDDETISLWNLAIGQEVQKLEGHIDSVRAITFSPDGSLLASASDDQTVRLWNPATGQEIQKLEGHTSRVNAVVFSPDGSLLASASGDKTIRLWNPTIGQEVQKLEGHTGSVNTIVFSPDGSLLASASDDETIRLWNPATGQEIQTLEGDISRINAVAFSPDGSLLASASGDYQTIILWNLATGQEVQKFKGHTTWISAVVFSPDGSLLASASYDQTIRLWNPVIDQKVQKLEGHTDKVNTVVFSPDGSLLASASYDQTIRLWNPAIDQEIQKLEGHTSWVNAVVFSPDGSLLASASGDKTIRLWNLTIGQGIQKLEGHTDEVNTVVFSPDGSLLASASGDETIRLWNPATGQEIQKLEGYTNWVYDIAFSPDGLLLASASGDQTIRLWNLATRQEVQKLEGHTDRVSAVVFSPDGSLLASASYDRSIRLWNPTTGQEVQKLKAMSHLTTPNFANDNGDLLFNRGIIKIKKKPLVISTPDLSSDLSLAIEESWIQRDNHNFLWLPQEYRNGRSAFHNNAFAFGLYSGQVSILQFSY